MAEEGQGLYHCERCDAIFSAPLGEGKECAECGEQPVASSSFGAGVRAGTVVVKDEDIVVRGSELADLVEMQKSRRRLQMQLAFGLWTVLLIGAVVMAVNYKNSRSKSEGTREGRELLQAKVEKQRKLIAATGESLKAYDSYMSSPDIVGRATWVVGGVDKATEMRNYEDNPFSLRRKPGGGLMQARYVEEGTYPRLEGLLVDGGNRTLDLVCWKIDGEWRLDWEQHVRYSEKVFSYFLANKEIGKSEEFRLYLRRRYSARGTKSGESLQLVCYEPSPEVGKKFFEAPQIKLGPDSPYYEKLKEYFNEVDERDEDAEWFVGRDDPKGTIRVVATLAFVEGEEGEPELSLEKVSRFHWMEFEPVVEANKEAEQEKSE